MTLESPLYFTGEKLVAGVYKLKDQHGFPINMTYEILKESDLSIDWMESLAYALSQGIDGVFKMDSLLLEIKSLIPNSYESIYNNWVVYFNSIHFGLNSNSIIDTCNEILREKRGWNIYKQ